MSDRALQERLVASPTRMGEYLGAPAVAGYGDTAVEFAALRRACGITSLTWRQRFLVRGPDRVRWLNGMVTNNIRGLDPNRGVYSYLLNPQGRILADMVCFNCGDHLVIETDAAQVAGLREALEKYIIMDEVELADAEPDTKFAVTGPRAAEVLRSALAWSEDLATLAPLHMRDVSWHGATPTVIRTDFAVLPSFEVWLPATVAAELWQSLHDSGATPVGYEAMELLRVWAGRPQYGADIGQRYLPQETAQDRALHFNKGCYVGQEIVERIHSRGLVHRLLAAFAVNGPPPAAGARIQVDGKDAGEVTSAASLPLESGAKTAALGYIRREAAAPGTAVQVGGSSATVVRPPIQ